eukprot:g757.t1
MRWCLTFSCCVGLLALAHAQTPASVTLSVFLANNNAAGITPLAQKVSDPSSSSYAQYLTQAAIKKRFAAPKAARDAVATWFTTNLPKAKLTTEPTADLIHAVVDAADAQSLMSSTSALYKSFEKSFASAKQVDVVTSPFGILALDSAVARATVHARVRPVRLGRKHGAELAREVAAARTAQGLGGAATAPIDMIEGHGESLSVYLTNAFIADYNTTWTSFELRVVQRFDNGVTQTERFEGPLQAFPTLKNLQNYDAATVSMRITSPAGDTGAWLPYQAAAPFPSAALPAQVKTTPVLRSMYGVPRGARVADVRATQAVGEFSEESFSPPLLDMYRAAMGQAAVDVTVDGPNPIGLLEVGEGALDVQTITTLAPDAPTSWVAVDPNVGQGFVLEYAAKVNGMAAPPLVHSISWGAPEASFPRQYVDRLDLELAKLALRGVSMVMASGDNGINSNGATCAFTPGVLNGSPWVTVVGATQFSKSAIPYCNAGNANYRAEFGECNDVGEVVCSTQTGAIITSSGGFSGVRARPWYQDVGDAVGRYAATVDPAIVAAGVDTSKRGFPDVAAAGHSFAVFANESFGLYDGTSAASPTFAAIITLLNSERLAAGQPPLGFLNPLLYQLAQSKPACFNDVTVGSNGATEMEACQLGFDAAPRWDATTGHGTPNYAALREAVLALGPAPKGGAAAAPAGSGAATAAGDAEASAAQPHAAGGGGATAPSAPAHGTGGTDASATVAAIVVVAVAGVAAVVALFAIRRRGRGAAAGSLAPSLSAPAPGAAVVDEEAPYRSSCSHDAGAPDSLAMKRTATAL